MSEAGNEDDQRRGARRSETTAEKRESYSIA